jgi:histidine triad (HIT) family protein
MATIFTKIINGEIPCYKIAENADFLAFLDVNPVAKGHTLVVPKMEVDYIFNLDDSVLAELMVFAKKVARAIDATMDCVRTGVAVVGLEVPHTHIHLIPINNVRDLSFSNPRIKLTAEEYLDIAAKIRQAIK